MSCWPPYSKWLVTNGERFSLWKISHSKLPNVSVRDGFVHARDLAVPHPASRSAFGVPKPAQVRVAHPRDFDRGPQLAVPDRVQPLVEHSLVGDLCRGRSSVHSQPMAKGAGFNGRAFLERSKRARLLDFGVLGNAAS